MASSTCHFIHISYKRVFDWREEEEEVPSGILASEPHLLLVLGCVINFNERERIDTTFISRHRFINCAPSDLKDFIQNTTPFSMDFLMDHEDAETTRLKISNTITYHVINCIGIAGLKGLKMDVILEVCAERREEEVGRFFREMRMAWVQRHVDMGEGKDSSSSTMSVTDEDMCVICFEEMVEGGKEVVRTPCMHEFHACCIRRWFEKSGLCPICRFYIGLKSIKL